MLSVLTALRITNTRDTNNYVRGTQSFLRECQTLQRNSLTINVNLSLQILRRCEPI
jgi:hypothetical protein